MPDVRSVRTPDHGASTSSKVITSPYELHLSLTRGGTGAASLHHYDGADEFRRPLVANGWTPLAQVGALSAASPICLLVVVMEVRTSTRNCTRCWPFLTRLGCVYSGYRFAAYRLSVKRARAVHVRMDQSLTTGMAIERKAGGDPLQKCDLVVRDTSGTAILTL
jgi:hypothetical protein